MPEFDYEGVHYSMTEAEIEAAYRFQQRQYRLKDAKRQIEILLAGEPFEDVSDEDVKEAETHCVERFGLSFEQITAPDMLELFLAEYEDNFDCNEDENSQWENAILSVMDD